MPQNSAWGLLPVGILTLNMEAVHYSGTSLDIYWRLNSIISQALFTAYFLLEPEDGGSVFLQITGAPVLYYTALHARI
jgi:hypothetical protein